MDPQIDTKSRMSILSLGEDVCCKQAHQHRHGNGSLEHGDIDGYDHEGHQQPPQQ